MFSAAAAVAAAENRYSVAEQAKELAVEILSVAQHVSFAAAAAEKIAIDAGRVIRETLISVEAEAKDRATKAVEVAEKLLVQMVAMDRELVSRETSMNMVSEAAHEVMDAAIVVAWTAKLVVAKASAAKQMADIRKSAMMEAFRERERVLMILLAASKLVAENAAEVASGSMKVAQKAAQKAAVELNRLGNGDKVFRAYLEKDLLNPSSSCLGTQVDTIAYCDEEENRNITHMEDDDGGEAIKKKINNEKLPPNRIKVVQLYDFATPEDLITQDHPFTRDDKSYFFTKNNRKGQKSSRITPGGSWIPTIADDPIHNKGIVIGFKRTLCFHKGLGKRNEKIKTNWIMHEYCVGNRGDSCDGLKPDDWVLCSIYKRPEPKNKRFRDSNDESAIRTTRIV